MGKIRSPKLDLDFCESTLIVFGVQRPSSSQIIKYFPKFETLPETGKFPEPEPERERENKTIETKVSYNMTAERPGKLKLLDH